MFNSVALALLTVAAITSQALADTDVAASATDTKKIVQNNFVATAQKGVKLSGYVDAGYSYNFTGSSQPTSTVNSRLGSDSAQRGDFNLYALKLALEKALSSENKAQAGFRADVMIGEDANYFVNRTSPQTAVDGGPTNTDMDSNALFLEQAYASFRVPVGTAGISRSGSLFPSLGMK